MSAYEHIVPGSAEEARKRLDEMASLPLREMLVRAAGMALAATALYGLVRLQERLDKRRDAE